VIWGVNDTAASGVGVPRFEPVESHYQEIA
jgi:hypothetical protein